MKNSNKKIMAIAFLSLISTVFAFAENPFCVKPQLISGFDIGEFLTIQNEHCFSDTQGGFFIAENSRFSDYGTIGDSIISFFADYSLKTDFNSVLDSSIESGLSAGICFCNAALVPVWNINSSSFNLNYRFGFQIGFYGFMEDEHSGWELDAYFQSPFNNVSKSQFSIGLKRLLLSKPF